MTAHELAQLLLAGPDVPVYVRGYESGINDVAGAEPVTVVRDVHTEHYYGAHETVSDDGSFYGESWVDDPADIPRTQGIYLSEKV